EIERVRLLDRVLLAERVEPDPGGPLHGQRRESPGPLRTREGDRDGEREPDGGEDVQSAPSSWGQGWRSPPPARTSASSTRLRATLVWARARLHCFSPPRLRARAWCFWASSSSFRASGSALARTTGSSRSI